MAVALFSFVMLSPSLLQASGFCYVNDIVIAILELFRAVAAVIQLCLFPG